MDMDDYQRVQKRLDLNETLVWGGRPMRSWAFTKTTTFLMLFGCLFGGISSICVVAMLYSLWGDTTSVMIVNGVATTAEMPLIATSGLTDSGR